MYNMKKQTMTTNFPPSLCTKLIMTQSLKPKKIMCSH
jgi:hypothetical protein